MRLEQKKAVVEDLRNVVSSAEALVLVEHSGLTVNETTAFRRELDKEGASFRVIKNTLFVRAVEGTGREFLAEGLAGPLALAYTGADPAAMAKVLTAFKKTSQRIEFKGGFLGDKRISADDVKALAALPPAETLKAMLLGALAGVPRKFLGTLQAPARDFVGVLKARENQLGEQGN